MKIGIIGLPNVGKSTIFSLLSSVNVPIDKFPFTTINPNIGVVSVPDERLDFLANIFQPEKKTYSTIKFVDIAGLIKGSAQGAGLGNKFLATIREVDAIVHVVRYFKDDTVPYSEGMRTIDPIEEINVINTELCLADLEILENYKTKLVPKANCGDKISKDRLAIVSLIIEQLNKNIPLNKIKTLFEHKLDIQDKELSLLISQLLTYKPTIYLLNYDETVEKRELERVKSIISENTSVKTLSLSGKFELSLNDLLQDEKLQFRKEYNISDDELKTFITESAKILNLIRFYTTVGTELRAWMIKNGSTVLDAAGKIHTDIREGFINSEVYNFSDIESILVNSSFNPNNQISGTTLIKLLHEKGLIKIEGKNYIVRDGDIIKINFKKRTAGQ